MAGTELELQQSELEQRLAQLIIEPSPLSTSGRRSNKRHANSASTGVARAENVPNLFTCAIDVAKLQLIRTISGALASSIRSRNGSISSNGGLSGLGGGGSTKLTFKPKRYTFHAERPNWKSDIRWVSADDEHTFGLFQSLFDKLGIAAAFAPILGPIVLFSGFLVIRQCTRKSTFHSDFSDTNGKAYTLMTPLEDMSDLLDCHLLAKLPRASPIPTAVDVSPDNVRRGDGAGGDGDGGILSPSLATSRGESSERGDSGDDGVIRAAGPDLSVDDDAVVDLLMQYRYELGRGICFGDGFIHATQTGDSPRALAFLCFTFGAGSLTDEEWANAEGYISQQGPIYQDPWGNLVRSTAFRAQESQSAEDRNAKKKNNNKR